MLARTALTIALLGSATAVAAAPSDGLNAPAAKHCVLAQQLAPHGKGVITPIVKCEAKTPEIARNDQQAKAPVARN